VDNVSHLDELTIRIKYPRLAEEVKLYIQHLSVYALSIYSENALFYPNSEDIEKISLDLCDQLYTEAISALHCYIEPPRLWQLLCKNLDTIQRKYIQLFLTALP
jgi:hypothetical protein